MTYPEDCVTEEQKKAYNKAKYQKYKETHIRASKERYERKKEEILKKQKESLALSPERQERKKAANRQWYQNNRDRVNSKVRNKYKEDPEHRLKLSKKWRLKAKYGLTEEGIKDLLSEQNGCCAICKKDKWGGTGNVPHIDHDHKTGKVRGLLCFACNTGIGKLGDTSESLERALVYLRNAGS